MDTIAKHVTPSLRLESQWHVARDFMQQEIVRLANNRNDPTRLHKLIRRRRDLPVDEHAVRACIDEFRPHKN